MVRLHRTIAQEHGHYAANLLASLLRTIFDRARLWGMLKEENPVRAVEFFQEEKRERFLTAEEIARLDQALMSEADWRWRAFFPLSLLLGTRRGELATARWADIDFAQAVRRIPNTKSGRPHLLPLPRPAVQILEGLPSRHNSEWVFPGEKTSTSITAPSPAWQRIRRKAGLNGDENVRNSAVRQHDLRRTLGSWLAASGYSLPLIGRALNHANVSTTAVYARLDLDHVRRTLEDNVAMMLAAGTQMVNAQTTGATVLNDAGSFPKELNLPRCSKPSLADRSLCHVTNCTGESGRSRWAQSQRNLASAGAVWQEFAPDLRFQFLHAAIGPNSLRVNPHRRFLCLQPTPNFLPKFRLLLSADKAARAVSLCQP